MFWPGDVPKDGRNFPLPMRRNLTKREILRTRGDISKLFCSGKRVTLGGAKLVYRKNALSETRVFVTLVKKYGNSVQRNRAKRVVKEVYRNNKAILRPGWDLGFILFPGRDDFRSRQKQVMGLIRKAGLFSIAI